VRLLKNLMLAIVLIWASWFGCQSIQMARTQNGHWDTMMRSIGQQILRSVPPTLTATTAQTGLRLPAGVTALPENLSYQVWHREGHAVLRSVDAPAEPFTTLNFDHSDWLGTTDVAGRRWRVYTLTDATGSVQVQVAKCQELLDAELALWRNGSAVIAVLLIALLGTVSWLTICWTMRPVHRVRDALSQRKPLDLRPVPTAELPQELRPLVEGFNAVLAQLDTALRAERHFLADAAHELRTPLAVLTAQARLVQDAQSLDESRTAMAPLVGGIERAARLTEQLLDSARLDAAATPGGRGTAALHEVLALVAHDFAATARPRRQRLVLDTEPCALPVCVDTVGVLMRNLIDNALRYGGDGARVQVLCRRVQEGDRWFVQLGVRDNGPGVPPAERGRIFDRFYRVPGNTARGSGIGLSLVAGIAQLHGARIETGSGLDGRGFSVRLLFPVPGTPTPGDAGRAPPPAQSAPPITSTMTPVCQSNQGL
jgi:two-component system sensor histidine kinase QseC